MEFSINLIEIKINDINATKIRRIITQKHAMYIILHILMNTYSTVNYQNVQMSYLDICDMYLIHNFFQFNLNQKKN